MAGWATALRMRQAVPYWSAPVNGSPDRSRKNYVMPNFGIPHRASGNEQPVRAALNWRRGHFRVWLLLSAGWIMGWTI